MKPTLKRAALVALLATTAILPARTQQAPVSQPQLPEQPALALKAATRYREAVTALVALAGERAASPSSTAADAALVEHWVAVATELWAQQPDQGQLARELAALRESPLAAAVPALKDRLGALLLGHEIRRGGPTAGALAAELGMVREWWLLGPFDNERGKGHERSLPAEQGFDPTIRFDGKRRKVSWRQLPGIAPHGIVPLGELVRPPDQATCLLATAVHAESDCSAALLIGSSGSFRVLVNGREAGSLEVERNFRLDQDGISLHLRAGWNLLVCKFSHQEGAGFLAAARLRGLDGSALRTVRTSAAVADLRTAAQAQVAGTGAAADLPQPDLGARTSFAAAAASPDPDPAALFRLAWQLHVHDVDGEQGRADLQLAERAEAALPGFAEAPYLLSQTRTKQRASRADRDDNPRRADLERALAANPRHVEAMLQLAAIDLDSAQLPALARPRVEAALAIEPASTIGSALLAETLMVQGLDALAYRILAQLRVEDCPVEFLPRLASVHLDRDEDTAALAVLQHLGSVSGAPGDQRQLAIALMRSGRTEEGLERLRAVVAREPHVRSPRAALAEWLLSRGRTDEALAAWGNWLEACPEDEAALMACSEIHRRNGDLDRQVETLRAAVELNPNLRDAQRHLEFLAAEQVPFFEPHRVDVDAILAAHGSPPADAMEARDPLHHVLQQHVVRAHRNGTTSTYVRNVIRVLNEDGARRMAYQDLPHYPGEQRTRILSCTVRKSDGTIERPRITGGSVTLGGLRPGDVVDVEGRVDDVAPGFFGDYFGHEHWFASVHGVPLAVSLLSIVADAGRTYRWQARNGAPEPEVRTMQDGVTGWHWRVEGLGRYLSEPRRPSPKEGEPLVRMTTWADWDQFSEWWWNLIRNQIVVTPAMREKVRELVREAKDDEQRIAAVQDFVTNEIRYEAWEFGVHGYKPYSTDVIYERRHGDCKDKALLLCAMLGELGIESHPVLIHADELRSEDDLDLPLVHHFNHCIAWLPAGAERTGGFLDGTATLHPPDTVPEMDQGARVLVVKSGKAELRDVPWTTPEANAEVESLVVALRGDGSATIDMEVAPLGNEAAAMRNLLASEPARRTELVERMLLEPFGKVVMRELTASDVTRLDVPVSLRATFDAPEAARKQGDGLLLPGALGRRTGVELAVAGERSNPLLLGAPRGDRQRIRWRLPAGMRAAGLPAPVALDTPFASFRREWRIEGDEIVVERELKWLRARILPGEYAAFREFTASVVEADAQRLLAAPTKEAR